MSLNTPSEGPWPLDSPLTTPPLFRVVSFDDPGGPWCVNGARVIPVWERGTVATDTLEHWSGGKRKGCYPSIVVG